MDSFICKVSHERDIPGGGFRRFTAGEVYKRDDIPGDPETEYFEPPARPSAKKKTEEVK